ncbi:acyl-CoA thioesterase [Paraliomyxa miuraensis]|uniref:acyl-CoA thioesterase n=1 Tax=Paraliomyxa miuraensis TaxID=376150 RepID=UPI002250D57E|nr:thioesterase family protein [Paraliomyxa miuraensis]MCX4241320.1 acyl-CoA thioesterase [Paraliomyxa miuraensis]
MSIELPVAWGDMDAFGHVNNTVYFRWFESARIAFFYDAQVPHQRVELTQAPILASATCTFELPLTFPDTVRVLASIVRVGTKSFTMRYEIHSLDRGRRAAHGEGAVVWYDYASGRSTALPDELRERLLAFLPTDPEGQGSEHRDQS